MQEALGTSLHTGDVLELGIIRVQPKASTTAKVLAKLDISLHTNQLSREDAASCAVILHGCLLCVLVTLANWRGLDQPSVAGQCRSSTR